MKELYARLKSEFENESLFEKANGLAIEYIKNINSLKVYPSDLSLALMDRFDHALHDEGVPAADVLDLIQKYGSPNTITQLGGRYFGFVNGGAIPASLIVKSLSAIWDQCGGLYVTSPINAKLESVCEKWLVDIFSLPPETKAGFVSGTSMANLTALTAARYHTLQKMGWDVNEKGLRNAPPIRIIAHEQIHASIRKTLAILGFGLENVEWMRSDSEGRADIANIPDLDESCILILQAGNVNSGSFDHFDIICDKAKEADAWVHIDGAFGLWARACKSLNHLTKGIEKADSWAVDGHKTLNTPYDNGIVLCKHERSMVSSLRATGEYLIYSDKRDPINYGPEMSKRSRAIELWATMISLGKSGIDELVEGLHQRAVQFSKGLSDLGYEICNEVVFNQVLARADSDEKTEEIVSYIQQSRVTWLAGSKWKGRSVIRISVCSWMTTEQDVAEVLVLFRKAILKF